MSSTRNPPLSAVFDELMRHYDHYDNHSVDNEFIDFVISQEACRKKWEIAEKENTRLKLDLQNGQSEMQKQEKKLQDVRRQLESKLELIPRIENEKSNLENRVRSALILIKNYMTDIRLSTETRERLTCIMSVLDGLELKRINQPQVFARSPGAELETISEAETTDLSMTQSEDDLDLSTRATRSRRSKRLALEAIESQSGKRRKSGHKQILELTSKENLIAQTNFSVHRDGQVHAVSTLEAVSNNSPIKLRENASSIYLSTKPSAPPFTAYSGTESDSSAAFQPSPPKTYNTRLSSTYQPFHHTQQSSSQIVPTSMAFSPSKFGRTLSSATPTLRPHMFCQKNVIRPETCQPCGKKIKFSKTAMKCKDCKATCHPGCKELVPLPCITSSTPSNKQEMGSIADYTPATHPMVPALIQHCVNEIEVRYLNAQTRTKDIPVGLYRVPGTEKDVKDLKEKFLRGKGIPNLGNFEIHAICGCIKDFLRSLSEPIVGRWFWRDFNAASDIMDPIKRQAEINRIILELPPPNQDTLAFVMLHLQRVAEAEEVKMPVTNLAKIFGPTIVGYSGPDIDAQTMLRETKKQQLLLETLLSMDGLFWQKFLHRPSAQQDLVQTRSKKSMGSSLSKNFLGTPSAGSKSKASTVGGHGRKIYFTDESPKEGHFLRKKKTYFD